MAHTNPDRTASANKQEAILYGKQLPTLLTFAVPIICGNLFQSLYNIVDAIVVGKYLGNLPLSGISAASPIMDLVYGLIVGACTGVGVLVSQLCGAGEWDKLKKVHATAFTDGIAFSLILTAIVLLTSKPILVSEKTEAETVAEAMVYLSVVAGGLIFNFLYVYYAAILRSYGNSRFPFIVLASSSILHAVLDIILIKGLRFGVAGVAASTVSCQVLSALALMYYTHRKCAPLSLARSDLRIHKGMGGIILSYAWATAMQSTVVYAGRLLIQGMLTPLGRDTVTGYNMGMRLEVLFQGVSQGLSAGTVVCMAQNFGHRNAERGPRRRLFSDPPAAHRHLLHGRSRDHGRRRLYRNHGVFLHLQHVRRDAPGLLPRYWQAAGDDDRVGRTGDPAGHSFGPADPETGDPRHLLLRGRRLAPPDPL